MSTDRIRAVLKFGWIIVCLATFGIFLALSFFNCPASRKTQNGADDDLAHRIAHDDLIAPPAEIFHPKRIKQRQAISGKADDQHHKDEGRRDDEPAIKERWVGGLAGRRGGVGHWVNGSCSR